MKIADLVDGDHHLVEERIETTLRGQKIMLSADILNTLLATDDVPSAPPREFSPREIHEILRPGERVGPLTFNPACLSDTHRAVWYIYSRSMVNKARNFTHLTGKDYHMMASILSGEQRDVGEMIFQEMRRFRFNSTTTTTIPFPQLVSFVLSICNIWHLIPEEPKVTIPKFGKIQLGRMGITVPLPQAKSKRMEASPPPPSYEQSVSHEGQSSRAASPAPSFIGATIQNYINESLQAAVAQISKSNQNCIDQVTKSNQNCIDKMNYTVRLLIQGVNHNFMQLVSLQAEQSDRLERMENLMRLHLGASIPQAPPSQPFQPFIDPENPSGAPITIPGSDTPIIPGVQASTSMIPSSSTEPPPHDITPPPPPTTTQLPTSTSIPSAVPPPSLDPILRSPSHSSPSHHTKSSSSTEEIIVIDQPPPPSDIPADPVLPSSPTFTPHSPDHSSSHDLTSTPPDPISAIVPYTPHLSHQVPPPAPLRVNPPPPSDITFPTHFSLSPDDKKGENSSGGPREQ